MDSTMSKIFETLNLNSLSTEMHNLSLNELKSSLASLSQFVIIGSSSKKFVDQEESETQTMHEEAIETKEGATSEPDAVTQVNIGRCKTKLAKIAFSVCVCVLCI